MHAVQHEDTVLVTHIATMVSLFQTVKGGLTVSDASASDEEDISRDLRKDPEARAAFLATFTADEEKAIMRQVDIRFCVLIGLMFMVKNVNMPLSLGMRSMV